MVKVEEVELAAEAEGSRKRKQEGSVRVTRCEWGEIRAL